MSPRRRNLSACSIRHKRAPVAPLIRRLFLKKWPFAALLSAVVWTASHAETKAPAIDAFSEHLSACFSSIDKADRDSLSRKHEMSKTLTAPAAAAFDAAEDASLQALDDGCLSTLARQLAAALHTALPEGFDNTPALNLETLRAHFYRVPPPIGLMYRATMGDGAVFMTHELLLSAWLNRPRRQIPERMDRIDTAFDSGVFYATVFSDYIPVRVITRLPIQPPAELTAAALLITESETAVMSPSIRLVAALIKADLVVVGSTRLETKLPLTPACYTPQVRRLLAKSKHDDAQRLLRACYTQALTGTPRLERATREAQAFVDRLSTAFANR